MDLTIQTQDEWLSSVEKPAQVEAISINLNPNDWVVVCAGFEDRAVGVLERVASSAKPCGVLLINYEPFIRENKANSIRELCRRAGVHVVELTYNRQEPSSFGDAFVRALSTSRGRILVDVSAMSRILIVQVLVALGSRGEGFKNCHIAYTEAVDYPPSKQEAEDEIAKSRLDPTFSVLFLSSGVFEVTVIPELSSLAPPAVQTRLIVFPSLDAHQLTALRTEIQPSRFTFIHGEPPDSDNAWRKTVISEINGLATIPNADVVETSTLNYVGTLDSLLRIYSEHIVHERLIISPTGSKMQTVAVGIFRAFVADVQIVYPTPESYLKPHAYTHGIGRIHTLSLDSLRKP